jgi:hypothetical protein
MSIISTVEIDNSPALAKRFAALTAMYIDNPEEAKSEKAKIPLENLFRILEMFRYNAFADESRRGVLALEGFNQRFTPRAKDGSNWHASISAALEKAFSATFDTTPKDKAIDELQAGLRGLASNGKLPDLQAKGLKRFLSTFETTLA